jgi:Domain of unknown function (DUF5658)
MFRRLNVAALFVVASVSPWSAQPVAAQTDSATPIADTVAIVATVQFANPEQVVAQAPRDLRRPSKPSSTDALVFALQATTIAAQALDIHSTLKAVDHGAIEANPMMSGLVHNQAAFIGVKAGLTAGFMYVTHKMAKRNKTAAILTAAAVNSVYLVVAHHNYKVARSLQ